MEDLERKLTPLEMLFIDDAVALSDGYIHWAARRGPTKPARLLQQRGTDPNAPYRIKLTTLHMASQRGMADAPEVLIVLSANPRAKNKEGKTPPEVARVDCRFLKPSK